MDAKLSIKLGANKDVTKNAKKDAIQVAKLGENNGVTKDAKIGRKNGHKNGC